MKGGFGRIVIHANIYEMMDKAKKQLQKKLLVFKRGTCPFGISFMRGGTYNCIVHYMQQATIKIQHFTMKIILVWMVKEVSYDFIERLCPTSKERELIHNGLLSFGNRVLVDSCQS